MKTWLCGAVLAVVAAGAGAQQGGEEPQPETRAQQASPPEAAAVHVDLVPAGPSVDERLAEIQRRVQRVASYPSIARARELSGEALVEFRIGPGGLPEDVRIRRSSGSNVLDRAAERAVREAAPLPHVYGLVSVPVRFQLIHTD